MIKRDFKLLNLFCRDFVDLRCGYTGFNKRCIHLAAIKIKNYL